MKQDGKNGGNTIGSIEKTLQVVEALRDLDGARVTELANHLEWPKSTVHSHLETLEGCDYLVKEGDQYRLSLRFLDLGEYVKHRDPVYSMIEPRIETLATRTGERVQFVVDEHGYGVYVRAATGEHAVSTGSRIGRRRKMLHATAAGKAILAHKPRAEVDEILEKTGLPQMTPNTITDRDELLDALEQVRERGYAFNHEEHIEGLRAVAAPIRRPSGELVGTISVPGPAHRMRDDYFTEELPELILGACNEVELDIAHR
ncbi:IclR family transcriptional regulator [Natronorubrum sp. FCH18a]|uniref:IclR family transcriptional regulator n=1 Tax=Natronorubrum sp. FCH18a TaxID=3447018 RepID=UPI003F516B9B